MSTKPIAPTIPNNAEHFEAVQEDLNRTRAELKTKMSDEERVRLEVIEECSAKLEAAGVPFLLWAASHVPDDDGRVPGFWQFNKLAYGSDDYRVLAERCAVARSVLFSPALVFVSKGLLGTIVTYTPDHEIVAVYRDGLMMIPPPKDGESPEAQS